MSSKRVGRDLISSVPDEVLGKILSFLPTRVAASTSVLSKRWRNLLALVDTLDLSDASGSPLGFPEFVEKTLALFTNSRMIKRFHLKCEHTHEETRVNFWIRSALDRGFLELHLESAPMCRIETEFFTSNTLVELTICDEFYPAGCLPPGGVFFPALKRLALVSVCFEVCDMYEDLVTGCPVLEELVLLYVDDNKAPAWNGHVFSPSIKRLTIHHNFPDFQEDHRIVWFKTPSLVYLDYSGHVSDQYVVDFGSLIEARLNLRPWELHSDEDDDVSSDSDGEDDVGDRKDDTEDDCEDRVVIIYRDRDEDGDVTGLVAKISNVKTLHLSSDSLEVFHFLCKSMPVFHNLLKLSFESDKERGWQVLPLLLKSSPNLETLVIKGLVHKVTYRCGDACVCIPKKKKKKKGLCCLSACQVKELNIFGYGGTCRERIQMSHFLANLKCLETVKVGVEVDHRQDYMRITNALINLPRVSLNCRIHFI